MGRKQQLYFEDLIVIAAKLPWWVGVLLALTSYLVLHHFAGISTATPTGLTGLGVTAGHQLIGILASFLQYVMPIGLLLGAGLSAFGQAKRRRLLDRQASLESIRSLSWQDFERLVGEAYRRQGYKVTEVGGGGADGGVDLVLTRWNEKTLVQCKRWKVEQVGVKVVRELYGVMAAEGAAGGIVVTSGRFTNDALAFADGKNLELVDGEQLLELIREVQTPQNTRDPIESVIGIFTAAAKRYERLQMLAMVASGLLVVAAIAGLSYFAFSAYNRMTTHIAKHPMQPIPAAPPTASRPIPAFPRPQITPSPAKTSDQLQVELQARVRTADDAFDQHYVAPAGCANWQSDQQMKDCVNDRMRAKAAFLAAHPEFQ